MYNIVHWRRTVLEVKMRKEFPRQQNSGMASILYCQQGPICDWMTHTVGTTLTERDCLRTCVCVCVVGREGKGCAYCIQPETTDAYLPTIITPLCLPHLLKSEVSHCVWNSQSSPIEISPEPLFTWTKQTQSEISSLALPGLEEPISFLITQSTWIVWSESWREN